MINGKSFFDQPVKSDLSTDQGDEYTTDCLLDYSYFKKYKMIAIDLNKQQALDSDPKAIQQIHFTGNLENKLFFIIDQAKERVLDFSQGTVKVF